MQRFSGLHFAKRLNLRKNSKTVNISSITDSRELINVDEVELYVTDEENTSSFHINEVLAINPNLGGLFRGLF